jgi:hypothetical protein
MANVLLVSERKLKSFTNINKNVDIDAIRAEIAIAQDLHLQPLLGTKFYNALLSKISLTGNTFNSDQLELVDEYIGPFLIQVSYFEMIPHLHYRTMNRGIVEGQMESANSVDIETMKYLRSIQKQRADFYKMRLQDFLITGKGQNKFPEYLTQTTQDGMIADKTAKYNSPIVLRGTTRKGWSKQKLNNLNSYSEIESSNPPCSDCY